MATLDELELAHVPHSGLSEIVLRVIYPEIRKFVRESLLGLAAASLLLVQRGEEPHQGERSRGR